MPKNAVYVAIVGSRKPTDYGRMVTYQLASGLAQAGVVIVSGLALGLDAVAHQAAIEAGGTTVAVQARGLDKIYPVTNRALAIKILEKGAIISEYPIGMPPLKQNFVARNRLISGLSQVVVVPEAGSKSGSLWTVKFGLDQGRHIMAVPANITSKSSAGSNNILRKGGLAVTGVTDVLELLDMEQAFFQPVKADSSDEAAIIDLISQGITKTQDLIDHTQLTASQFANIISLMEISGVVRNLGAGQWVKR